MASWPPARASVLRQWDLVGPGHLDDRDVGLGDRPLGERGARALQQAGRDLLVEARDDDGVAARHQNGSG